MSLRSILASALFVICGVFSYIFVLPNVEEVVSLRSTLSQNSKEAKRALDRFQATQDAIKQFQNLPKSSLDLVDAALPNELDIADLYVLTDDMVARSGLIGENISIDSSGRGLSSSVGASIDIYGEALDLKKVNVSFSASGNYETLKTFLRAIEEHLRIFDVESFNISAPVASELGADTLRFGISARTYYDISSGGSD